MQALRWLYEERQEAVADIMQGLDDAAAGQAQPVRDAFDDIRKEYSERSGSSHGCIDFERFVRL